MNLFNEIAAREGMLWVIKHPESSIVDIEDAAPKLNPARRHFIEAAINQKAKIFYRWNVGTRRGHVSGGYADNVKQARERIFDHIALYQSQGHTVNSYAVYNSDDVCVLSMDML